MGHFERRRVSSDKDRSSSVDQAHHTYFSKTLGYNFTPCITHTSRSFDPVLAPFSVGLAPMGRSGDLNFDPLSRFGPSFLGGQNNIKV